MSDFKGGVSKVQTLHVYLLLATYQAGLCHCQLADSFKYPINSQNNCFFWVCTSAGPDIVVNPKEVTNKTSATLTCNLTNPATPVKSHYWKKNNKTIKDTEKHNGELHFTEYKYVLITLTDFPVERFVKILRWKIINSSKPSSLTAKRKDSAGVQLCMQTRTDRVKPSCPTACNSIIGTQQCECLVLQGCIGNLPNEGHLFFLSLLFFSDLLAVFQRLKSTLEYIHVSLILRSWLKNQLK